MEQQPIKQYTLQDIFDNAWNAYIVRGEGPGFDIYKDKCVYLAPNGCRCAIGHSLRFLSDEQILGINETNASDLMYYSSEAIAAIISYHLGSLLSQKDVYGNYLVNLLQRVHDVAALGIDFNNDVEIGLRKFALKHSLSIPSELCPV